MIFSTGLKKIYESISKQPADKRQPLFNQLQEKIVSNPALAYKFELLEKIEGKKNKFDKDSAKAFFEGLQKIHSAFVKKNDSVAFFYKEEKKLFEFFNVNQRDIVSQKLDLIVNKKDNQLNENVIIEYITDNRLISNKQRLQAVNEQQKEHFVSIRDTMNETAFDNKLEKIQINSNRIFGKRKNMVEASLRTIKEEAFKNFKSACNKAYKLTMITEKILHEAKPNDDDDLEKGLNVKGKTYKADNLKYIKGITIEVPDMFKKGTHKNGDGDIVKDETGKARQTWSDDETTEVVTINFVIPIYPVAAKLADNLAGIPKIKNELYKLKRVFMNKFIYQQNITTLDPVDSIWEIFVPENVNPESGKHGQEVEQNGYYTVGASFSINIFVKKAATPEKYFETTYSILKAFDQYIPSIDFMSSIITPDEQKDLIANTAKGRKTDYGDRSGADKYYRDTHGTQDDTWTDDWFEGDAEDSEVDPGATGFGNSFKDKKGKKVNAMDNYEIDLDSDDAAREAEKAAKNISYGKRPTVA